MAVLSNQLKLARGVLRRTISRIFVQRGPDSVVPLLAGCMVVLSAAAISIDAVGDLLPPIRIVAVGAPLIALWLGNLHTRHSSVTRGRMIVGLAPDISASDLTGSDLRNFSFRGKDLTGTKFSNANLTKAQFAGCAMNDSRFTHAILRSADLRCAHLRHAGFFKADLRGARFDGAHLIDAVFLDADMRGAKLRQAKLVGADLRSTNLGGACLVNADLRNADFEDCDLRGADLRGAKYDRQAIRLSRNFDTVRVGPGPEPQSIDTKKREYRREHEVTTGSATTYRAIVTAVVAALAVPAVALVGVSALVETEPISTEVAGSTLTPVVLEIDSHAGDDLSLVIIEDSEMQNQTLGSGTVRMDFTTEAVQVIVIVEAANSLTEVSCHLDVGGDSVQDTGLGTAVCIVSS